MNILKKLALGGLLMAGLCTATPAEAHYYHHYYHHGWYRPHVYVYGGGPYYSDPYYYDDYYGGPYYGPSYGVSFGFGGHRHWGGHRWHHWRR